LRWLLLGALLATAMTGCEPRYGALQQQWSYATGDTIAATPQVQYDTVFIGSWDGYEYALTAPGGTQRWRTFLGRAPNPACDTLGVTSSPVIIDGTGYLGGGYGNWYALNLISGNVLWSVPTGSLSTGHYNWSSPVALSGHAFVGVSSLCDQPLVQGQLLRVNLLSHQIENTWNVVPTGQVGGTIWTKPVVDAARNTVYVTTGNRAYDSTGNNQPYSQSLVAVDASTLAIKGHWQLPLSDPTPDPDWGTGPTLFTDSLGRDLVSAANKNGILYAFLRDNVSAGPVWTRRLAQGAVGDDPGAGAVYSNGWFDGQRLYYAAGVTTVAGQAAQGAARALDPRTGAIIWEKALPSKTYGALTMANGMLVVPSLRALRLLDPATGEILYENPLTLYAAAAVGGGRLFVGDVSGVVHAYKYPSSPGAPTAAVALARGCQVLPSGVAQVDGPVRVTRLGRSAGAAAAVALYPDGDCSGKPLVSDTLSAGETVVVPTARSVARGTKLSVSSSRAVRLGLRVAR
jgi:outer membrane protein assembly factor BamB